MNTDPASYDSRGGDEIALERKEELESQRADPAGTSSSSSDAIQEKGKENPPPPERKFTLPPSLAWIPANLTWSQMKPVIRCSLTAWVSLVFTVVRPLSRSLGQASFLLIISAFLSPPQGPFISVLEREVYMVFFVTVSWAWSCLGIKLASLARSEIITTPEPAKIFTGGYLEPGPSAIMAVFLFIGSAVLLYIKASRPPGPLLFATIFGCIGIDIIITTAVLFPYPYYVIGRAVVLPIALHSGISLFFSATVFPSTISSFYISKCHGVLLPLRSALQEHRRLLQTSTESPELSPTKVKGLVAASEAGLVPVASALYLLKRDVVWSRFSPSDFMGLHGYARRMVVRVNGMCAYFGVIDPTRERLTTASALSVPETSTPHSPGQSRSASVYHDATETDATETLHTPLEHSLTMDSSTAPSQASPDSPLQPGSIRNARRRNVRTRFSEPKLSSIHHEHIHHRPQHRHKHLISHGPLLPFVLSGQNQSEPAVGLYESIRYADLEEKFSDPAAACHTEKFHRLLKECCDDMLAVTDETLNALDGWLNTVTNKSRFKFWRNKAEYQKTEKEKVDGYVRLKEKMDNVLEVFEKEKRHIVVDPYRASLDSKGGNGEASDAPPHRHLFHCYVYQYHLWQFVKVLSEFLGEVIRLENERTHYKLWVPTMPWRRFLAREGLDTNEDIENDDDEDPDIIQGMQKEWREDLGHARMRDPDALPPKNAFEWIMNALYRGCSELVQGNSLYAIKAGVLTILLCIPILTPSSAKFSLENRLVWGIIMGQLTLVRFRGDTSAGLVSRLLGTLFGAFVGAGLWYASTGLGRGNPYGLAAICGGLFPLMMFGRLYWPGSPMTNILFFVTAMLVIGYSWYNTHPIPPATFPHWGVDLAIRRLVLVAVGVAGAFLFSFLPPSTTLRKYQRTTLATATGELGAIYCSIVSFANTGEHTDQDIQEIVQSLVAIRAKLKRSLVLKQNIIFEFSLRGRWPAERYQKILDLQLKVAYHLSYLMSVVVEFEPAWSRAFLRRCRFLDSEFQGEMFAVISLISTALRSGTPIPQITPCPLLNRFLRYNHGFDVVREEEDNELGLPSATTVELLENEQYMYYCVGVSTAFSIVNNLDKLMVATKELVGEQYHIHGIGIAQKGGYEPPPTPGTMYPTTSKEV